MSGVNCPKDWVELTKNGDSSLEHLSVRKIKQKNKDYFFKNILSRNCSEAIYLRYKNKQTIKHLFHFNKLKNKKLGT